MLNGSTQFDVGDEAVRRLLTEFAGRFDRGTVEQVVDGSRGDLNGVPSGALPELVERLARERLLALTA